MDNKKLVLMLAIVSGINGIFAAEPTTAAKSLSPTQIIAKPIPAEYHFPTPTATIAKWIANSDTAAMRAHGWELWSAINTGSGEFYRDKELPIWETWYGLNEVFSIKQAAPRLNASSAATFLATHRGPLHAFIEPHQFFHMSLGLSARQALGSEQSRLMSINKFSPDAATFIITPHQGVDGKNYLYNSTSSLHELHRSFSADASGNERKIQSFPAESWVLKPVFGVVKAEGLTPLPLWQGAMQSTHPENPTQDTWKTCVLIDPQGQDKQIRPATEEEIAKAHPALGFSCKTYLYGTLSTLYWFKLTKSEAATFNKTRKGGVDADDFAVLLALHVTTKEIPYWTWQTFYWQPGADTPGQFPGSKADQPKNMKAPWNNYAMCVNYSQTVAPNSKKMVICLNPYLETTPAIPSGMSSNCMSCHGVARFSVDGSSTGYPLEYKAPVALFSDPSYFNSATIRTDFSWAISMAAMFGGSEK